MIVGAGAVGATFAYALAREGMAEEIVLSDVDRKLAEGEVLDLSHGLPFLPPVRFRYMLSAGEQKGLHHSAGVLQEAWRQLQEGSAS